MLQKCAVAWMSQHTLKLCREAVASCSMQECPVCQALAISNRMTHYLLRGCLPATVRTGNGPGSASQPHAACLPVPCMCGTHPAQLLCNNSGDALHRQSQHTGSAAPHGLPLVPSGPQLPAGSAEADPETVQELRASEPARKLAQLFVLDRLNKRELAVVHPILAALQQVPHTPIPTPA